MLERRDALTPQERARLGALVTDRVLALPEVAAAGTVMAFWAFGSELPTMPLIEELTSCGVRVALPRIVDGDLEPRTWRPGEPTTTTPFGALEPADGEALDPAEVDVIVTPAVAFDRAGRRVGYGGGFYDRFFPRARSGALRVGAAFGVQLVDGRSARRALRPAGPRGRDRIRDGAVSPGAVTLPVAPPRARAVPWREIEYAALDFETTGLDFRSDTVISYGVVPVRHGRAIDARSRLTS